MKLTLDTFCNLCESKNKKFELHNVVKDTLYVYKICTDDTTYYTFDKFHKLVTIEVLGIKIHPLELI